MKEINLGRIILQQRHKRGITQDELAEYVGVSKGSVSKWETGTTYPDITVLPKLAAYFKISIDELMGYEPQMVRKDIQNLYCRLSQCFLEQSFHEVLGQCRAIVKQYYSCDTLLFYMGTLYVNHADFAGTPEETEGVIKEAEELFIRVRKESEDAELAAQAISMEALCLLKQGKTQEVFELLEPLEIIRLSPEPLLASAYQMTGNDKEARRILQAGSYQSLMELVNHLMSYMGLCMDQASAFEDTYKRMTAIMEAFQFKTLHPSSLLSFYITAACGFINLGDQQKALDVLEQYTDLVRSDIYPLQLHGDTYFNLLDEWLENNLVMGHELPRNQQIVRISMTEAVRDNPAFTALRDNLQFQTIIKRLESSEEE